MIEFKEVEGESLDEVRGMGRMKYAMAVAVAGGHHIMAFGSPGCGKTMMFQRMPQLMPKLLPSERESVKRIYSIAGLGGWPKNNVRPFRMPHQTASIEGMYGGGIHCNPGEISLAHNGVLFLDEAAEFRTSVLQMLRVPIENGNIALSKAGHTTVYPAHFQLALATMPCPCGNFGSKNKICLCSARSIEHYWNKFTAPLSDRITIRIHLNGGEDNFVDYTIEQLRAMIKLAWERQLARQGKLNQDMTLEETMAIALSDEAKVMLTKVREERNLSECEIRSVLRVARTVADMSEEEVAEVREYDMDMALELHGKLPIENL